MAASKKSSAASKPRDYSKCKPGAYFFLPYGRGKWLVGELRNDRLWYRAGDSEPFAVVQDWQAIADTMAFNKYTPEVM